MGFTTELARYLFRLHDGGYDSCLAIGDFPVASLDDWFECRVAVLSEELSATLVRGFIDP